MWSNGLFVNNNGDESMVEEIGSNLFRVKIPLPDSPLKFLNSYIIISAERNLINRQREL